MVFLKDVISKPITGEWGTDGEETNILRTTNFTNSGVIDFSDVVKRTIPERKVELKKLLKGDIIIEKSGGSPKQPVGRVVFFNSEGTYLCNNFTSVLRPKREKVDPKYLHYILFASHKFGITSVFQNKTTGIINLQLPRYVEKLPIPLPPLKTQQRIAGILDNAAALRDKTAQLLKEYDLLAQSIFLEMFGDPVSNSKGLEIKKLGDLGKWQSGGTPSRSVKEYYEGNFPWLSSGELNEMYISDSKEHISELALKESSTKLVPKGSLLLGMYDTAALKSTINTRDLACNQAIAFGILDEKLINIVYAYNIIQIGKDHFRRLQRGARQKNLNLSLVKGIKILYPPIELQNEFADKIALIEQQKALAKQELQESEGLFNCLLQQAFKGEL
jgi:type I restriction enzyme S subunit